MSHFELKRGQHVTFWKKKHFCLVRFLNFRTYQFWNEEKYKVLDFELKLLQSVTFSTENFLAFQISDWIVYNVSELKLKILQRVGFCIEKKTTHQFSISNFLTCRISKKFANKKPSFIPLLRKNNKFCFFQAS